MNLKPTCSLLLVALFFSTITYSQNVGIGTSTPGAKLDISSSSNGILIPRVALTATNSASPLSAPVTSTMIYNTATAGSGLTAVSPGFYYWDGGQWVRLIDFTGVGGTPTVSNASTVNTLTTTVNSVTSAGAPIINTNVLGQNGSNQLISTINGQPSAPVDVAVAGDVTGNLGATTLSKIQGSPLTLSSLSAGNLLQYNGSNWVNTTPAALLSAATTHTLSLSTNTLTSTVNGVVATSSAVSGVSNSSSGNNISTTVNGVSGIAVPIINTISNTSSTNTLTTTVNGVSATGVPMVNSNGLSLAGTSITSTVNGIGSSPLDISSIDKNIYNSDGTLTGARTVTMAANNLTFSSSTGNLIFSPSSTGSVGIGTATPTALLHLVSPNTTGTSVQLRLAPTGGGGSSTSVPSVVDFYSTFDAFSGDQAPRRTASIKGQFSGGVWGNEALIFEVGTGASNDAAAEPTERMRINGSGQVRVASLAGTGYRPVYADASGNLYAISGSSSNKQVFSYTGANQTFTVPSGVNIIYVKLWGAGGASAYSTGDGPGGGGGFVSGFLSVTPGASLTVIVGRGGIAGTNSGANSGTQSTGGSGTIYGGGGLAGHGYSGTGGGRSAIQIVGGTDAVTAGAGGGGSRNNIRWGAGAGGGLIGTAGANGQIYNGGSGGTQVAGGIEIWNGTSSTNTCAGNPGTQYQGGRGCTANDGSGGGGGGYYGGAGGGGGGDGPAGGGSSYISGLIPYMPIRNEQGMTINNYSSGYTVVQNVLTQPGGTDGPDYTAGVGVGGVTVSSGTTGNNGGNGQVVIYW